MKGDERLERANKRTNEHLAKLRRSTRTWRWTRAWVEMATGSGTKWDIDTDDGDAMIDVEISGKKMRVNRVVEVVRVKAVVNEMDEESMDDAWGYGLEADEWVIQDWEKREKELGLGRKKLSTWWRS